jgi:shikimate 5-dehydrogenase
MIVGANPLGRALAFQTARAGALPIVASRDRDAAHALAKEIEGRFVPFEALYTTMHEVLVVCSEERQPAGKVHANEPPIHPAHLQPHLVVMDLTSIPARSPLLRAAAERGCRIVSPRRVFLTHLLLAARLILGRDVPAEPVREVIRNMSNDDD